jgi:hypothetical protein
VEKSVIKKLIGSVNIYDVARTIKTEINETNVEKRVLVTNTFHLLNVVKDIALIIDVFLISNKLGPKVNITDIAIERVIVEGIIHAAGINFPKPINNIGGNKKINKDPQFLKNCLTRTLKYATITCSPLCFFLFQAHF